VTEAPAAEEPVEEEKPAETAVEEAAEEAPKSPKKSPTKKKEAPADEAEAKSPAKKARAEKKKQENDDDDGSDQPPPLRARVANLRRLCAALGVCCVTGSLTTPADPCGVWRMVPLSIFTDEEEDGTVGQYWEVQDGQKRQRKSLDVFKVEVAKVKDTEIKKGAGKSPRVLLRRPLYFPGLCGARAIKIGFYVQTGKALKDIPAVMNCVSLHTIKKADPHDALKVWSACLVSG
jgi:hypothetical protein